jgi:urease gamma subunit
MTRIYIVTSKTEDKRWLIEANNPAQALKFVTSALFEVAPAGGKLVADLMAAGEKVRNATKVTAPKQAPEETKTKTIAEPGV